MASDVFEVGVRHRAAGDQYSDMIDAQAAAALGTASNHPLDGEAARKTHRKLLDWLFHERSKQAENRLQMATDADFYDGLQWDPEDAETVRSRGQMPLVYNEVAPMVDWLIGTERRTRVDWKVLPRTEDDVDLADVKTKVLKYVSDINQVPFARSRAFSDAIKSGVGWVDDGARDDPTMDVLYSKYEDWRNVLWDSASYELDLSDARYLFRWRWVDADVAEMMFPERWREIRRAVVDAGAEGEVDQDWYLGAPVASSGQLYASGDGVYGEASRRRIKLIECQYRMPAKVHIVTDGPMRGAVIGQHDRVLSEAVSRARSGVVEKVMMRQHVCVFTEADMLALSASAYRHNRFSLTPIWCYRRSKDRLPYGVVRRVRDIQCDLNKRASKALFLLNTNQIIANKGAVEDKNVAREEADMPDGYIETNPGKLFEIRRDTDAATGQIQMMTLAAQSIQKSAGVNNENLGRQTNAVSGAAIEARQLQGSVATTEPFDNHRYAIQIQGEKLNSNIEQFYTEEKVVRLTGTRGKLEWLRINQPEQQPDGSVRYLNDITASQADFVVSEQDYAGTLRQVMFDSMSNIAAKLPPELALRFLRMAYEYSDLPNKDAIAEEIRKITGEQDPNKQMTPEEAQAAEQQMALQAEAMQAQRESAMLALEEQRAKVREINAKAAEMEARAGGGGLPEEVQRMISQVQGQAAYQIDALSEQLRKVQMEATNKTLAINKDADTKAEVARIDAASRERVAEIQGANTRQIDSLMRRLEDLGTAIKDVGGQAQEANKAAEAAAKTAEQVGKGAEEAAKKAEEASKAAAEAAKAVEKVSGEVEKAGKEAKEAKPAEKAEPALAPQITVPITFEAGAFQVDAKTQAGNKTLTMQVGDKKVTGTIKADKKGGDK